MVSDRRSVQRRARSDEDKDRRRGAILGAAARLFRDSDYEAITVAEVAEEAGTAKGTVYLYFGTKEELFLAATLAELEGWLDVLDARLDALRRPAPQDVARVFSETLSGRRDLLRLAAILHPVLERNAGHAEIVGFKRAVLQRVAATGARFERTVPSLAAGEGARFLLGIYALLIGLWQVTVPGPAVARALEEPALRPMRLDFHQELAELLPALLAGLAARKAARR